ncbi:hypothetical protein KR067_006944 [Drosophila pandora]|nr:hypothetical protein KR067_006944 [Drosophila pandora]
MDFKLVCALKSCNKTISSSQPTIHCWLCENVLHAKCAGFTASVSDAISRRSGLHFCCDGCRAVQDEMRSFMRQTKSGFKELISGFRKINDQLCALDTQFSSLQLLNESPKRKKSAFSDVLGSNNLQPAQPTTMHPLISLATPRAGLEKNSASECLGINEQLPLTGVAPELKSSGLSLRAVAPRKAIFVSRLMPDATVDDVRSHLLKHLKVSPKDLAVFEFNFKHKRNISSFKIVIPESYFEKALDPSAWPEHSIIHEFLAKDPLNHNFADSAPKN